MSDRSCSSNSPSKRDMDGHVTQTWYGNFQLTDAAFPSCDLQVIPTEGYRHDWYHEGNRELAVIMAAATKRKLFDLFMHLLDPLKKTVDVILETSHHRIENDRNKTPREYRREEIYRCIAESFLWRHQELLEDDGLTGISVINAPDDEEDRFEVQLCRQKLIVIYAHTRTLLAPFEEILAEHKIPNKPDMRFLNEAEHIWSSSTERQRQFQEMLGTFGIVEDD